MKILVVAHRFPYPPHRGDKIRVFNAIRHLAQRHEVTVCSLVRSDEEYRDAAGMAEHCHHHEAVRVHNPVQVLRMVAGLPTATPATMSFFRSWRLQQRIDHVLDRSDFDLIYVSSSSAAQYVLGVRGIPKLLDFCDMDSEKWLDYAKFKPWVLRPGYAWEGRRLRHQEAKLAASFDFATVATIAELDSLREIAGATVQAGCWPNGVDTDFFTPDDEAYDPQLLSFVGRMDYYPNRQCMLRFAADVWPGLKALRPALKLVIVGADPPPDVRALSRLDGIEVTGSVPDVRPYVRRSAAMVAPLAIGRGTQNKILEAMAMGVPVVTSSTGAGGVDAQDGAHLLVADTPQEIERAVLRIIEQPHERARLAMAGRSRVLSHHAWPQSMHRLDALIELCRVRAGAVAPSDPRTIAA